MKLNENYREHKIPQILVSLHPTLTAEDSALEFVESLCLKLLAMLCAVPPPLTAQDVEERVARTFPTPLDSWAIGETRDPSSVRRKKLVLPLDRIHHLLQKEVLQYKIDTSVSACMTSVLEYVSTDILRLSGTFVKTMSQKSGYQVITTSDIKTAMCADKVLVDVFYQEPSLTGVVGTVGTRTLGYGELVRDLMVDERAFLRDLNLVVRVFKDELDKILDGDSKTISLIFGNIVDIYELTVTLLGNLEDAMEMSQDSPTPYIGSCFEELAEVEEFRAYVRYANIVTKKESREALQKIVDDPVRSERLDTAGHGFRLAVKYCLPRLLLQPVAHVLLYHSYVRALLTAAPASDDRESFKQPVAHVLLYHSYVRALLTAAPASDDRESFKQVPLYYTILLYYTAGHGFRLAVKYCLPRLLLQPVAHVLLYHSYVRALLTAAPASDDRESFKQVPLYYTIYYTILYYTAGHGFRLAVKYCLPRLLLQPVAHVLLYHSYVRALLTAAPASDDRESFKQVECNLHPIKKLLTKALGNGPKIEGAVRSAPRARRQLAIDKCNELARLVDNWDSRDVPHCCNEFIREDSLSKIGPGKRIAERRAFLFDGLLLLCKPVTSLVTVNSGVTAGGLQQLKLKEKLHIRKLKIVDRPDGEEGRNLIELCPRVGPPVVLAAASGADKRSWMADLVLLNTKPMLDRSLDSILLDLERRHPLQLPPVSLYRFAEPDSSDNIVLEERPGNAPLIKGATLLKLVERLTYHVHADLNLVRTFLTTYRSFCSPGELLELLVERFDIPEPHLVYDAPKPAECVEMSASSDAEKLSKNTAREDWKRYRKEFQQPVKFRVINVLRHWVDQHFYDFERDPVLLEKLIAFLESVDGKPMKKWVQSVLKTVQKKCALGGAGGAGAGGELEGGPGGVAHVFDRSPPPTLRHVDDPERYSWHPLALHPLELARQLTLLEFQLYRQVKPSELVGAVWTKKDKEKTSPNLLRIIKHTTNFTRWMEKWVVESENLEERVAVLSRLLELALALRTLNNFNGVLGVVAACGSASVHRLRATFALLPPRLTRALDQLRELNSDHFKRYQERLRSINPPCVPFLGMYLTNILHIEEGNLDYLPNSELINFSKRRKVAEITGEIQQYQNQPYCLTVEPKTRAFLESLDPFPGMDDKEVIDYLYAKSLEIEPRLPLKQMPKFPRRYPELSLKPVKVKVSDDTTNVAQLSPTSTWDGISVVSLPVHDHGSREERGSLTSPRLERSSSSSLAQLGQLSLFDKGLALFDKSKSVATLNRSSGSARDEPPSPRDSHSPRHDRYSGADPEDLIWQNITHTNNQREDYSAGRKTEQVALDVISLSEIRRQSQDGRIYRPKWSSGTCTVARRAALSPRGAIVDAELFYSRSMDHLPRKQDAPPPQVSDHCRTTGTLPSWTPSCSTRGAWTTCRASRTRRRRR
ncbi:unnamed protein product [Euphydryas editha]|uniref:Protein son of sevenless n=1 Tax=Euphydryas editha TaxID=104508 RepID=A0AAU9UVJ3_EUPED|nr:unnamed protein product [Euphydryas editha]